jgi:signal transduction histidine kinase
MPRRDHRKRALLFLAAVLLPSAVLVGTTVHLIRQQRELAVRRAAEERALLALRIGQELQEHLRTLGDQLSLTPLPFEEGGVLAAEPALVALASIRDGRLIFPWEMGSEPSSALDSTSLLRYSRLLERGEEAEFRSGDLLEAARRYGQASEAVQEVSEDRPGGEFGAKTPRAVGALLAEARLRQARGLLRAGREEEARALYRVLAETAPQLLDPDGIPFTVYGLEGLLRSGAELETLLPLLDGTRGCAFHLALPALLAWRDVAQDIAGAVQEESAMGVLQAVEEAVAQRTATLQELENLRRDFPALLAAARGDRGSGAPSGASSWIPWGREPWVVGVLADAEASPTRAAVIRPSLLLGWSETVAGGAEGSAPASGDEALPAAWRAMEFVPSGELEGESLGPGLNGLRIRLQPDVLQHLDTGELEGWLFRLLLPVILLLTGFTAYLAWRDVRRETEAVRLRTQFVSSVTHELKTPLTSIRMFAETLRLGRQSSPAMQREYLDTVVHETERLSRLINNVLDFARIDRGERTYHKAPTDVALAAREATRAVAYPLAQGKYELVTEIAPDLPQIEADADALTQALLNLLSNAIKFSGEGSRIELRVFREGTDILLQVEDQGRGIAVKDRDAIFRDFVRTADAEREGIPGTGLGLSLVAHVAEAHGGRVEVESEMGQGSTFTIRIPVGDGSP